MTSKPISRLNVKSNNDNSYVLSSSPMLRPRSCPNFASRDRSENKNVSYLDRKVKQPSIFTEAREREIWSLLDNSTETDQRGQQQRDENFNINPLNRNAACDQPRYVGPRLPSNVPSEGLMPLPLASSLNWPSALLSSNRVEVNPYLDSIHNNNILMVEHPPCPKRPRKGHTENNELSIISSQVNHERTHTNHTHNHRDNELWDLTALHCPRLCSDLLPTHHNGSKQFHSNAKVGDEPIKFCIANGLYPNDAQSMGRTQAKAYSGTFHDLNRFFVSMNGFLVRNDEFIENAYQEPNVANCDAECSYELREQTDCDMLSRCNEEIYYDCSTDDEFTDFDVDGDENLFAVRPGNPVARVLESGDDDGTLIPIYNETQQNSSGER